MLLRVPAKLAVADAVRDLKANSSRWAKDQGIEDFAWQSGYAAFTVSHTLRDRVRRYIENQEQHHSTEDWGDEWKAILKRHGLLSLEDGRIVQVSE
jgi:putative transposase